MLLCIKNGRGHDAVNPTPYTADLLIEDGKIKAIGPQLPLPEDCEVLDATGLQVYPGFVEAHAHIGLHGYGIGYEGADYNERNDICVPQLRAIDGINPMDPAFEHARNAGVTCVCTGPGSANVIGGTFAVIKTVGKRVERMLVNPDAAMMCAFGDNPKRVYQNKSDSTRMSTAAVLRNALAGARDYKARKDAAGTDAAKQPKYDMKMEALLPVLEKKIPLKAHAHQANDLFTALRIAKEFDVNITLEHVTEGPLVVAELAAENVPMAGGPALTHASKFELQYKSWTTPGVLAAAGCAVSIITDAPVIPQQHLPLCAGLAVKAGMDPFAALQAITINPARHIGAADRVGSLEVGKDADVVITDGCPVEVSTTGKTVLIDGTAVFTA